MPKIIQNKDGGSIIYDIDDWLAGTDTTSSGSNGGKINGNPQMSQIDPLRKYGYISPSFLLEDVTGVAQITAYLRNSINVTDSAIIIGSNSLVHKLSTLTAGTISTTAPFPHTIDHAHTNEAGNDIALYYTGSTLRAFYSFNDDTDWDVGIYNFVADTFDDDFMSTVPTSPLAAPYLTGGKGYPHPLIVGDDDVLYIGDRNFVHAYDGQVGATGTFYPAVLTLPKGYVITSFATTQDINLAIGAYLSNADSGTANVFYRGAAKVWFWNYLALDPDYSRDLRDNYVSELIQWSGTIAAFTEGRKTWSDVGNYKLQALNGSQFEVVKTWNSGGLPIRGGVDNVANDLFWNSSGAIYAYTKRPDNGRYILNWLNGAGSGSSGMLKFFTELKNIHYSYGAGASNGGLQYGVQNYRETGSIIPAVAAPNFGVLERGRLTQITISFFETGTGRSLAVSLELDHSGSSALATVNAVTTNIRKQVIKTRDDGTPLGDFTTLQPQFAWGSGTANTFAPTIEWVRFDYTTINATNT